MRRSLTPVLLLSLVAGCLGERPDAESEQGQPSTPARELRVENVPEDLRHLVPLAEKWGIGDDVERAEFIDRASAGDRRALVQAITPHQSRVTAWLDSFGTDPMSDEAAAFMYMQLAVEEMRAAGMKVAVVGTGGDEGHAPARRSYEKAGYTPLPLVRYYQAL